MVRSVQKKIAAENEPAGLRSLPPDRPTELNEWRKQVTEQLQSTLDLHSQLSAFLENVRLLLRIDGISYLHEEEAINLQLGRQASHSCGYRLIARDELVGELIFRRERKFAERELALLEVTLAVLVNPLRKALKYRHAVAETMV